MSTKYKETWKNNIIIEKKKVIHWNYNKETENDDKKTKKTQKFNISDISLQIITLTDIVNCNPLHPPPLSAALWCLHGDSEATPEHGACVGAVWVWVHGEERQPRVHQAQRELHPGVQDQPALVARPQGSGLQSLLRPGTVRGGVCVRQRGSRYDPVQGHTSDACVGSRCFERLVPLLHVWFLWPFTRGA